MAIITTTRLALVNAIKNWPALSGEIKRYYTFEDYPGLIPGAPSPTIGDMPALEIFPASGNSGWVLNQSQQIEYPMRLTLWTKDWNPARGEEIWEETIKAAYQSFDGPANAHRVAGFSPFSVSLARLGEDGKGANCLRWEWTIQIRAGFWNPKTAS